jgi:hypothetical protein
VTQPAIHLDRETFDRAAEVADGFWIIATRHRPGFSQSMPEVNNRCLVFRLRDRDGEVLLVANGVDPKVIPEVKRLEQQTGLVVRYILSIGGGHHLMLPEWRDAFTEARVLVGPDRVPRINAAKRLMAGPRVEIMDRDNPLPQFAGQLDAVLFHGLCGFHDHPNRYEGGKDMSLFTFVRELMTLDDPCDELWLRHAATGTIIGGENLGWILSKETVKGFPFIMRMMFKADTVYVNAQARKVRDSASVAKAWTKVLAWGGNTLMGYHEPPGEGFRGDCRDVLTKAVEAVKQLPA